MSMWKSDRIDFDSNWERRPEANLWPRISILISILNDFFSLAKFNCLFPVAHPHASYAYHCIQAAASLVKVSTVCLIISVSKYCLIWLILILMDRVDPELFSDKGWASCYQYWRNYSLAIFIFLFQLLSAGCCMPITVYKQRPRTWR